MPKEVDHLLSVKIEPSDSLKAYNAKYWETFNEIPDCPINLAITQYKCYLPVGHRLRDSLTINQPTTMELLMQRINEHIRVEDDTAAATAKTNSVTADKRMAGKDHVVGQEANCLSNCERESDHDADWNNRGKGRHNDQADHPRDAVEDVKRKLNARTRITTVFKISIYRTFDFWLSWDCLPLKQHLEELVAAGHLDYYIDGVVKAAPHAPAEPNGLDALKAAPQGVINVIHGIIKPMRVYELREMIKKAEYMREVLLIQPTVKKSKTEVRDVLNFSSQALERIQTLHNDGLMITLRIRNFDIRCILIDQGSSIEIMYYDAFKQLKLSDKDLAPATSPLVGFNSQPEWPMEKIILLVKAGSVVKQVEFWMLKVPSTYNLIWAENGFTPCKR
ncbi:uncharacterized protein LOC114320083 [Camellia sinensis]|uniref:uncharacterized protein LOC114320083 n=1 Tax=Camellia sinensis TaxID=4442 RepID=UPI001035DBF9|nr:uncharacterized protein LOC114320083 [Camellia sinensis]